MRETDIVPGTGADWGNHRWSDVVELPAADVPDRVTESVPGDLAGGRYVELPESGWGALIGWAAGPVNLLRTADRLDRHITVTTSRYGAEVTVTSSARTPAEQTAVDDDINEYLDAAGVPPRESGQRWLIRLPPGFADGDAFFSAIGAAIASSTGPSGHPARLIGPLIACVTLMYLSGE